MDKWYRVRVRARVRVRVREYTLPFFFVFFLFLSLFFLEVFISALNKALISALNKDRMCLYRPFIFVTDGVPYSHNKTDLRYVFLSSRSIFLHTT